MLLRTYLYTDSWDKSLDASLDSLNTLVIIFGDINVTNYSVAIQELKKTYQNSFIIGASTAGTIYEDKILESGLSVTVLKFHSTTLKITSIPLSFATDSFIDGVTIAKTLQDDDLKAIFVLSEGLNVNGSQLTDGLASVLKDSVVVTGGLAGDYDTFEKTWVIADKEVKNSYITAVGFYGNAFHVAYSSQNGLDKVGIQRVVTKSQDNILYELDNQPALEIYKKYLGEKASELPASGLLFPLSIKNKNANGNESKIRTILNVSEKEHSITFAGDVPQGTLVTLMMANYDRVIQGAAQAAKDITLQNHNNEPLLSIAISCVARKLVLKQRTEEELEVICDTLPQITHQIGFYSYGEISPLGNGVCDLHNQTMTLTLFWESDAPST